MYIKKKGLTLPKQLPSSSTIHVEDVFVAHLVFIVEDGLDAADDVGLGHEAISPEKPNALSDRKCDHCVESNQK